jgi:3-hydroxyacyl-[acyl-carrier-protein] dehydratase
MLLNTFYTIISVSGHDETSPQGLAVKHYRAALQIEPKHPIFQGHFPGSPVVPGVCQIQMIIETLSNIAGRRLTLTASDTVKFLYMINPLESTHVDLDMLVKQPAEGRFQVQATLLGTNNTFLKFKGNLEAE